MMQTHQLIQKLNDNDIMAYSLSTRLLYIPTNTPSQTINQVFNLLRSTPATISKGIVRVKNIEIHTTPVQFVPTSVNTSGIGGSNLGVNNRLAFALLLKHVMSRTMPQLDVRFNEKMVIKKVIDIKFKGHGVFDFVIMTTSKRIPIAIHTVGGTYRHAINDPKYVASAFIQLESAVDTMSYTRNGLLELAQPIVWRADNESIRELMFTDIRHGFGVINNYIPTNYQYNGITHTLDITSEYVYKKPTDLKSENTPYYIIRNSKSGSVGELNGIQLDLIPKRTIPVRANRL